MPSVLSTASAAVPAVKAEDGYLDTEAFLNVCRLTIPIVEKLGTAFYPVKTDINGNIQRLDDRYRTDERRYKRLFTMVQDEMLAKTHTGASSCTKGLLWLKRAMEFMLALLQGLLEDSGAPMSKVVSDTYTKTLYQFHGFMVSSAFTLAFKFVPSRESFLAALEATDGDFNKELAEFIGAFQPVLADVHKFMVENGLDDPTKV